MKETPSWVGEFGLLQTMKVAMPDDKASSSWTSSTKKASNRAASPYLLGVHASAQQRGRPVSRFVSGELEIDVLAGRDSVWGFVRRPGRGGLAHRIAFLAGEYSCRKLKPKAGEARRFVVTSALGEHSIVIKTPTVELESLRVTVSLTPAVPLVVPFMPRDLYPLDANDDPVGVAGNVEAAQRGLNSGLLYSQVTEPDFGNVLYFQNLTALNGYCRATKTTPDSVVGGEWLELGFLLPTPPQNDTPPLHPLPAGEEVVISDAILMCRDDLPRDERDSARQFLQMLGLAYRSLDLPETEYRDWFSRAQQTLRDLDKAPEATIQHYGHRYVHPYTAAEYPDVIVQMSMLAAIRAWGDWSGTPHKLESQLKAGLRKFYDPKLKTLRRYLPNVGENKDADAVDSWYVYHPMLNLGALALAGDDAARQLFLNSIDYGIRSAHHFAYK